jgi:hypothetical protein
MSTVRISAVASIGQSRLPTIISKLMFDAMPEVACARQVVKNPERVHEALSVPPDDRIFSFNAGPVTSTGHAR